jgi:hypothetical protein
MNHRRLIVLKKYKCFLTRFRYDVNIIFNDGCVTWNVQILGLWDEKRKGVLSELALLTNA